MNSFQKGILTLVRYALSPEESFPSLPDDFSYANALMFAGSQQIIPLLSRAGLLQTARGVQGGYRLTRRPEEYTLGDVLRATEATLASVACLEAGAESCPRQGDCLTYPVWIGLDKVVNDYLDSITLQDILDRRQNAVGNDYVI